MGVGRRRWTIWAGAVAVAAAAMAAGCTSSTTSTPSSSTEATTGVTWVYPNLDGEQITVEESDSTAFEDGVPGPVAAIDRAAVSTDVAVCYGLKLEYESWLDTSSLDAGTAERAGAYARYALDHGAEEGCSWAKAKASPDSTVSSKGAASAVARNRDELLDNLETIADCAILDDRSCTVAAKLTYTTVQFEADTLALDLGDYEGPGEVEELVSETIKNAKAVASAFEDFTASCSTPPGVAPSAACVQKNATAQQLAHQLEESLLAWEPYL